MSKEAAMTVREDVVRILQSRGRQEGGTEGAGAVINNSRSTGSAGAYR
jgi:hypothetical protein